MTVTLDPTLNTWRMTAARLLATTVTATSWREQARPEQHPPEDWGRVWYVRGGRGSGKTWTASNALAELIANSPPGEWGVVGPTFGDARDICMEGQESGLLRALGCKVGAEGRLIEQGPLVSQWNRTNGHLRLVNGSVVYTDGADDGAYRIQGHNLRGLWGDEVGLWKRWRAAWDESIRYAVRLSPAKIILTGTPKRNMPARTLVKRLIADPDVANVRLLTEDNAANLDPATMAEFMKSKGTALERQELMGDLLAEVEGALWKMGQLDEDRVEATELPDMARVVVAIDPAVTSTTESDETGIVVVGLGVDGDAYVLADRSALVSPDAWARRAIAAYDEFGADRLVAEVNNGGDMVESTLRTVRRSVSYRKVHASRGKAVRAEPVAALYEQHKVHHVGALPELEDQLTQWTPDSGESPDRLDALVWALTDLMLKNFMPEPVSPVGIEQTNPWASEWAG